MGILRNTVTEIRSDHDPKTAEVLSKIIFFAEDQKIKDPYILQQLV